MNRIEALESLEKISYSYEHGEIAHFDDIEALLHKIYDVFEPRKQKTLAVQVPNEYTNINQEAFNEWMKYKKYKNKGAITKTLNMLNKYDYETQQEMVDLSIGNEYKGLFPPKKKFSKTENNIDVAKSWLQENNTIDEDEVKVIQG